MPDTGNNAPRLFYIGGCIAVALATDYTLGEPPNWGHPVVWMGSLVNVFERIRPRGGPAVEWLWGLGVSTALCTTAIGAGLTLTGITARMPLPICIILHGACLKTLMSAAGLESAALRCAASLDDNDLDRARADLRWLVSRDTSNLTPSEIAAAAIESVAENTSDSIVAPLLTFVFFGLPGALLYRAANTLDAMIGYRGEYEHAGKAAARFDDFLNIVPSRLTGVLFCLAAGPNWLPALSAMRRDHRLTASPNAGWPMSAAAGALDVSLTKQSHYTLNEGRAAPCASDIRRAVRLMRTALITGGIAVGMALLAANSLKKRGENQ